MTETSNPAADTLESPEPFRLPPWQRRWWWTTGRHAVILPWIVLIHTTAIVGLILFPLPGWRVFAGALALAWIGGLGTTVCYHRGLAHRSPRLHPAFGAGLA